MGSVMAAPEKVKGRVIDAHSHIGEANAEVVRRLDESVPVLVDVALAENVVPGMSDRMLLHCGPAID